MAFSYTAGSTADRDRVRLEIGDTDSDRALFQDAEIDDFLAQEGDSVLKSSARACETLAVRFARDFTFSADGASFQKGQITQMYMAQAATPEGQCHHHRDATAEGRVFGLHGQR